MPSGFVTSQLRVILSAAKKLAQGKTGKSNLPWASFFAALRMTFRLGDSCQL